MKQVVVVALAVLLAVSMAVLVLARDRRHAPSEAEDYAHLPKKTDALPALYASPDFSFKDQHGQAVTKASLAGQPYVANFVFTTCRTVCPLLTAKMVRLQRDLKDVPMRFVSFSVDPENDTVAALHTYAEQWNPDEKRWHLLETTPTGLTAVTEGFHVTAQKTDAGPDPVMHSAVFVLVDGQGVVRGVYDSENADDFKSLAGAARKLAGVGAAVKVAGPARSGEVLYHELSCSNCHAHAELAPQLGGLLGQRRVLETGLTVTADEAYVRESIVAPVAKRVKGYPLMMPSYAGHVSDEELSGLVQYVLALAPVAPQGEAQVAIDPVCHMQVRVTENALSSESDAGVRVYFCSAWCKARYAENPDAYRR